MPYFPWEPALSVNVAELDQQHREFIDALNQLHDTLMRGKFSEVLRARDRAMEGIETYVGTHFSAEERYMESIGYPGLEEHRALHREFATEVQKYRMAIAAGELVLNSELVKSMIRWVREHLAVEDSKYAAFAVGRHRR